MLFMYRKKLNKVLDIHVDQKELLNFKNPGSQLDILKSGIFCCLLT